MVHWYLVVVLVEEKVVEVWDPKPNNRPFGRRLIQVRKLVWKLISGNSRPCKFIIWLLFFPIANVVDKLLCVFLQMRSLNTVFEEEKSTLQRQQPWNFADFAIEF